MGALEGTLTLVAIELLFVLLCGSFLFFLFFLQVGCSCFVERIILVLICKLFLFCFAKSWFCFTLRLVLCSLSF